MDNKNKVKLDAAVLLKAAIDKISKNKFLVGFDGFIDQIIHVVDTRTSVDEYSRVETIEDYGNRILSAAGKSANIELVPKLDKIGGNGPLMANAIGGIGGQITLVGLLGYPEVWPIFDPMAEFCNLISCGNPGTTDALEFNDGKIMLCKNNTLKDLNWDQICKIIGEEKFISMLMEQKMVAITNWTELVELTGVIEKIVEKLPENSGLHFFFDFGDPEKRLESEIAHVLKLISLLNKKAKCILGLNLRESEQISRVLNLSETVKDGIVGLEEGSERIRKEMEIEGIVIHSVSFAGASIGVENRAVEGPFCPTPKITTGAGDHFNGGFCSALMGELPLESALLVGVATSGWYVRNGGPSPKAANTAGLLESWAKGEL